MSATAAFINSTLDTMFTGTFTMKLFTTAIPSTTGVEVTGGGYAAQTLSFSAASAKVKQASAVTFTNMPTGQTVVAWGVYVGATLKDEGLLSSPYTADLSNNTLNITYKMDLSGV